MSSNLDENELGFEQLKHSTHKEISNYIKNEFLEYYGNDDDFEAKKITDLTNSVMLNLQNWFDDPIPEKYKKIILTHIHEKNWPDLIEAFKQKLVFGTSGIRGKMSIPLNETDSKNDLISLNKLGFNSKILRGSNSINEITFAKNIYGLINYMKKNNMLKIVIGFDSRLLSKPLSILAVNLFLENDIHVTYFDEPNTLPELSFAVTKFKSDIGIEITASHNDKRYNGYKLITQTGSPPSTTIREKISHDILNNTSFDLNTALQNNSLHADSKNLLIISKSRKNDSKIYSLEYLHDEYLDQIISLISNKEILQIQSSKINIGFSSLHGTGFDLASRLFNKLNIKNIKFTTKLNTKDPLFPSFLTKQILDPSDKNTANVVTDLFIEEFGLNNFNNLDFLCYTDPDADRLGIIIPTTKDEELIYGKWKLLKANDVWTLFLWYMLEILAKTNNSFLSNLENSFIVKSFVTSDSLEYVSKKYGLTSIDGKVGFSDLTSIVFNEWAKDKTNIGMFEESCGFGLAGSKSNRLHILEKDGILSLSLFIEIVSYAKSIDKSIDDILNKIYLDSEIGFFATIRKELPKNDVFEGIQGELYMQTILKNVERFYENCYNKIKESNPYLINGLPITNIKKFSTGRYDAKFWKDFPDEGIRFYLDSKTNHITIRASGTEPKLRIFVQYRINDMSDDNILTKKLFAEKLVKKLSDEMEKIIIASKN